MVVEALAAVETGHFGFFDDLLKVAVIGVSASRRFDNRSPVHRIGPDQIEHPAGDRGRFALTALPGADQRGRDAEHLGENGLADADEFAGVLHIGGANRAGLLPDGLGGVGVAGGELGGGWV